MTKAMKGFSLAAVLALMLTPATGFAQRGTSPAGDGSAAAETSMPPSATCAMDGSCRIGEPGQRGDAGLRGQRMGIQRSQGTCDGQARQEKMGRGSAMQGRMGNGGGASPADERQRFEEMRAQMVEHMRRMAFRMSAIQDRLAAIDRGENPPPMPAMGGMGGGAGRMGGNGQAAQSGHGRGMRLMDGSGCQAGDATPDASTTEGEIP